MTVALRALAVDEEALRHDQMEVVLYSGHGNVERSAFAIAVGAWRRYAPTQSRGEHAQARTSPPKRPSSQSGILSRRRRLSLGLALKAAGASYANIVKIVIFVVGYKPELRPIIGQARSAFFEGMTPPASTLVGVSALAAPEWLIEIEAVAVVD